MMFNAFTGYRKSSKAHIQRNSTPDKEIILIITKPHHTVHTAGGLFGRSSGAYKRNARRTLSFAMVAACETMPCRLSARESGSFAYETVHDRMPVIIAQTISEFYAGTVTTASEDSHEILGGLSRLKYEVEHNKSLRNLYDVDVDAMLWNNQLEGLTDPETGQRQGWFDSPWLVCECYMYRRIRELFFKSNQFRDHDWFWFRKEKAFYEAKDIFSQRLSFLASLQSTPSQEVFCSFLYLSLWGNRTDLSANALKGKQVSSQSLASHEEICEQAKNVLVDDAHLLWNFLSTKRPLRRLDVVLDNAGLEFVSDLALADWLLRAQLVQKVVFHVKRFPWFVSDVTPRDFEWTLQLRDESLGPAWVALCERFNDYCQRGSVQVMSDPFWTTAFDYASMERVAPDLYHSLSTAELLIFKGDLNYRKLLGDRKWAMTTPFGSAIRSFTPTSFVSLRTLKADILAGVAAETELPKESDWMVSGHYAVIQMYSHDK